jgi:hypothetical protein
VTIAALQLQAFKRLYEIAKLARELDEHARTKMRRERSALIYEELLSWCRSC